MLSDKIKETTREAHQCLEGIVIKKLRAIRSDQDYARLLNYFYAYFSRLEQATAPYLAAEIKDRRSSAYLKADIEALGGIIDEHIPVALPRIQNSLQAFGALYVMEGSVMGGPYIVQMLIKNGLNKGFMFFSGYGDATHEKWREFLDLLNRQAETYESESVVIQSAQYTFEQFAAVFTRAI